MTYDERTIRNINDLIPVPEFDEKKGREGHFRYLAKKKHYARISALLIILFACLFIGTSAYAATVISNHIKTNKNGVVIDDGDSKTGIKQSFFYDDSHNHTVDTDSISNENVYYDETDHNDADYHNTKRHYADGTVKEGYHSFKNARNESRIDIPEIDPCPGLDNMTLNIFVDTIQGVNEYEYYAEFYYVDNRICNVECIKGGNGISVSNKLDVAYENRISNENTIIVYQRTEQDGKGGNAYININDYCVILEYYGFKDSEIEEFLKSMDLSAFI